MAGRRHITAHDLVSQALEQHGSIRGAAKHLGIAYTSLQWWIVRNNYEVKNIAKLVKRNECA